MWLPFWSLLSALFLTPGNSEVVESFDTCLGFFLDNRLPDDALNPPNPARICQTYKNRYRFATMYDRNNRIPRYSAYIYNPGRGPRSEEWMIEPQLVDRSYDKNMEVEKDTAIPPAQIAASQASDHDYRGAPFYVDRGHLNPVVHQPDEDSKTATFTLTNILPQYNQLNKGPWATYEQNTMRARSNGCTKVYVMVGAVPGNTFISGGRVNYPSHLWSAACCVTGNTRRSWGVIASNDWNVPPAVTELTLQELETQLAGLYGRSSIDLFNGSC